MLTHYRILIATVILLICAAAPSEAWLYDAGIPQHLGTSLSKDQWVAAPFAVESDCYATTFGIAAARAYGPADAGLDVYLSDGLLGLPGSAITKLPKQLVPLNTQYVYYYGSLDEPVLLKAGKIYSLVLIPTSSDFLCSVSWGAKPGTYYGKGTNDLGKNWYQLAYPLAVRVDGYAVPEPSAAMALGFSMLGLVILGKRRCKGYTKA